VLFCKALSSHMCLNLLTDFPDQDLYIGTAQERSLRPELAILDFFRSPRRCAPRDDRFVVGKGLDPFRNANGTAHPIRFATKAGGCSPQMFGGRRGHRRTSSTASGPPSPKGKAIDKLERDKPRSLQRYG